MYEKILVPLDGSQAAEIPLPYAIEIAARLGAEIVLVSVHQLSVAGMGQVYQSYLKHTAVQVQDQLKQWGAKEGVPVRYEVLSGKPAIEILRFAGENGVRLIAMSNRGASSQGPWLLGNIAAKVLRAANSPVLLVRTPPTEAALQHKSLVKRILVPLDGSRVGEAAVPCTVTLARVFGAELVLFHVVEQLPEPAVSRIYRLGSEMSLEINKRRRELAAAYLNSTARSLEKQGLKVATAMTTWTESTADQIIDYAEANVIDLIGMSTHGRSGVGRWVFGSVTDKVLHAGSLPVLVVRPGKEPYPA